MVIVCNNNQTTTATTTYYHNHYHHHYSHLLLLLQYYHHHHYISPPPPPLCYCVYCSHGCHHYNATTTTTAEHCTVGAQRKPYSRAELPKGPRLDHSGRRYKLCEKFASGTVTRLVLKSCAALRKELRCRDRSQSLVLRYQTHGIASS